MKKRAALYPLALLFLLSSGLGQQKSLTLEESVSIGLENSKVLHASQMKSAYAGAKASEVAASLYPSLKLQASYQRLSSVPEFKNPYRAFRRFSRTSQTPTRRVQRFSNHYSPDGSSRLQLITRRIRQKQCERMSSKTRLSWFSTSRRHTGACTGRRKSNVWRMKMSTR